MDRKWHLAWPYGELDVHSRGGMLGGVKLRIGDRWISPFYQVPWIDAEGDYTPMLLRHMRSEFACVPFGVAYSPDGAAANWRDCLATPIAAADRALDENEEMLHGYGAVADWTMVRCTDVEIQISLEYPHSAAIRRLTRVIRCDRDSPSIDFSLTIEAREKARRPIGLHPNLALPERAGSFHIRPGDFQIGFVHPSGPETGVSRGAPGATFFDLAEVPLRRGGTARFDRLPFAHNTEEIVQLCGSDGSVELINDDVHAIYRLTWDAAILPSLLLWISNRGRSYAPWSSRNLCVGVEPVIGAFDLGSAAALARNPIKDAGIETALLLDPASPTTIRYRFEAREDQGHAC